MSHRKTFSMTLIGIALVAAFAAFAFFTPGTTRTAHAETHGIQNLQCNIAPMPIAPSTPETLTCTFSFRGTSHTFMADFEISPTVPHLNVASCTLDTKPVHIGPCP